MIKTANGNNSGNRSTSPTLYTGFVQQLIYDVSDIRMDRVVYSSISENLEIFICNIESQA